MRHSVEIDIEVPPPCQATNERGIRAFHGLPSSPNRRNDSMESLQFCIIARSGHLAKVHQEGCLLLVERITTEEWVLELLLRRGPEPLRDVADLALLPDRPKWEPRDLCGVGVDPRLED